MRARASHTTTWLAPLRRRSINVWLGGSTTADPPSEVCSKADIGKAFVINLGFVGTRPTAILET